MDLAKLVRRPCRNSEFLSKQRLERFQPKDLTVKNATEVAHDRMGHFVERYLIAQLLLDRCDGLAYKAARNNEVEETEVRVHIECESVRGDATRDVNSYGGDF